MLGSLIVLRDRFLYFVEVGQDSWIWGNPFHLDFPIRVKHKYGPVCTDVTAQSTEILPDNSVLLYYLFTEVAQ